MLFVKNGSVSHKKNGPYRRHGVETDSHHKIENPELSVHLKTYFEMNRPP